MIARHDVGVVGGPVIKDGKITGGAYVNGKPLFEGMNAHFGGYMYRGILRQEVEALNPDNAEVGEAWKMLYNEMVVDAESAVAGKSSVTKQLPDRLDRMMQFCEMIRSAGGIIVYDPKFHK